MNIKQLTPDHIIPELEEFMANLQNGLVVESFETERQAKNGKTLNIWLTVTALKGSNGHIDSIATTERDITDMKNREKELKEVIKSLQQALAEVKTLQEILPICSFCKSIRNDKGYYEQIEDYFHKHAGVDFSHTICPDCTKTHYPEYAEKKQNSS